jgi:hypothetical protein
VELRGWVITFSRYLGVLMLSRSDFYVYDVLDQLIISVALVKPRVGVFQVAYLLFSRHILPHAAYISDIRTMCGTCSLLPLPWKCICLR